MKPKKQPNHQEMFAAFDEWQKGRDQPTLWVNRRNWLQWLLPTPGNIIFTLLLISSILWAQNAGAIPLGVINAPTVTNTLIPYQGRLTDADGKPLSDTKTIAFSLYAEESGGDPLWSEGRFGNNRVEIVDGLFNVMLGRVEPLPQSVITENSTLYLGIMIDPHDEMVPRVQLGRVPYAVQAIQALTVPDGSVTSRKLKLSNGQTIALFEGDPWQIELTTDFVEIAGTRAEITLDTPQTVIVNSHFDFTVVSGGIGDGALFVNGNRQTNMAVQVSNGRLNNGQTWLLNLDAGTYTLYLAARNRSGAGRVLVTEAHTNLTWFSFAR